MTGPDIVEDAHHWNAQISEYLRERKGKELERETKNAWKIKYLERYRSCKTRVVEARIKEKELEEMRCTAIEEQYQAAVEERKERETELSKIFKETEDVIATLDNEQERKVLTYIYIGGKSWKDIAEDMSYSDRQVKRIHGNAVDKIKMSWNVMECHGMS